MREAGEHASDSRMDTQARGRVQGIFECPLLQVLTRADKGLMQGDMLVNSHPSKACSSISCPMSLYTCSWPAKLGSSGCEGSECVCVCVCVCVCEVRSTES